MRTAFCEKKQISRCIILSSIHIRTKARHKIQKVAGATFGGDLDGMVHIALWFSGDYHKVPYVNRNSDGDFKFNLDNWEGDWNDNNCLLCFCN